MPNRSIYPSAKSGRPTRRSRPTGVLRESTDRRLRSSIRGWLTTSTSSGIDWPRGVTSLHRLDGWRSRRQGAGCGRWESPRLIRTAQSPNEASGWVEVRHPFHPFRGQRFQVLKRRRVGGTDTLILRDEGRGSFAVPVQWTDRAVPEANERLGGSPRRLRLDTLSDLVELIELLGMRARERVAK